MTTAAVVIPMVVHAHSTNGVTHSEHVENSDKRTEAGTEFNTATTYSQPSARWKRGSLLRRAGMN